MPRPPEHRPPESVADSPTFQLWVMRSSDNIANRVRHTTGPATNACAPVPRFSDSALFEPDVSGLRLMAVSQIENPERLRSPGHIRNALREKDSLRRTPPCDIQRPAAPSPVWTHQERFPRLPAPEPAENERLESPETSSK